MKPTIDLKHLKDLTQKIQKPVKRTAASMLPAITSVILTTGVLYLVWNTFRQQAQLEAFDRRVQQVTDVEKRLTLEKDGLTLGNAVNATRAQVIGGILVLFTAFTAWRNLKVAEEKQVTERFSKAVEQLGHSDDYVRLGAIYSLERIANDSDKDYWQVIEILTAYVRGRSAWTQEKENEEEFAENNPTWDEPDPSPKLDIQAVLTVLNRRKHSFEDGEKHPLDLSATDLRIADLRSAKMQGVLLSFAHLNRADLSKANLETANLRYANLEGADCHAHLKGTDLREANLERADLSSAGLDYIDLDGDYLRHLKGANLCNADLKGANLCNANLKQVKNLDLEQLASAKTNEYTKHPDYLQPPQPSLPQLEQLNQGDPTGKPLQH